MTRKVVFRRGSGTVAVVCGLAAAVPVLVHQLEPAAMIWAAILVAAAVPMVAHEAGHAWLARRRGLRMYAIEIGLLPLARVRREATDDPVSSLHIALAGPIANLLLGAAAPPALLLSLSPPTDAVLHVFLAANLLGLANLLPLSADSDGTAALKAWRRR